MRLKVSDGDLVVIVLGGEVASFQFTQIRSQFSDWFKKRGLVGVDVVIVGGVDHKGLDIKILSVNDIFDEQVC